MRSGRLAEFLSQRKPCRSFFSGGHGLGVCGHARTVANLIVGVRGTVATDAGVLVILMRLVLGKCTLVGKAREVVWLVFMVKGSGVG